LEEFRERKGDLSSINVYLHALVQSKQQRYQEARQNFGRCLMKMPLFREAWLELLALLDAEERHHLQK
jgi:hypothetical protein